MANTTSAGAAIRQLTSRPLTSGERLADSQAEARDELGKAPELEVLPKACAERHYLTQVRLDPGAHVRENPEATLEIRIPFGART